MPTARLPAIDHLGTRCYILRETPDLRGTLLGPDKEEEEKEAKYSVESTKEKLSRTPDPDKLITKQGQIYTLI